jgi:hypothetical protein
MGVERRFGDDTLGYFSERADPAPTRQALVEVLHRAKRNKAFQIAAFLGLAVDGTTVGRCHEKACDWCRPYHNAAKQIAGYRHHLAMISVVGGGLTLPFDVEPYGPKDSEYAAGQRLLRRALPALGPRFADYVVVDAGLATNTFLHVCDELGIPVVARLKDNLPELAAAVEKRFSAQPPHRVLKDGKTRIEIWDAADFDPRGDASLANRTRASLSATQPGWHRGPGGLVHQLIQTKGRQPGFVSHGQEPLGNREPVLQRLQILPGAGTHLPSPQ